ncbi:MAG: aminopeptidase P family protein [Planctomycetota bacterium]
MPDSNASNEPYFIARRNIVRKQISSSGIDALLVSNLVNVRYLTGFTGSAGSLILMQDRAILVSDFRYQTQISEECSEAVSSGELEVAICAPGTKRPDFLMQQIRTTEASKIGYEHSTISKFSFDQLAAELSADLVRTDSWVEDARAIKDQLEIKLIRNSISVNERSFQAMTGALQPEMTEREFAHNLEHTMRSMGASGCAFDPIVGVGPRAALPHGTPSDENLASSPYLLVDWGTCLEGYCSDLTRIIVTGEIPAQLRKIYEIVLAAHDAAIAQVRPGIDVQQLDHAARSVIEESGYGEYFGHGLGHSFGLEIHETPFASPTAAGTLQPNMVLTIEPGIYLPGEVGVRIEDDVLVTEDGCEVLSTLPTDLDQCAVAFNG